MREEFVLVNLSCASCAQKIEDEVRKLPEVTHAELNFSAAKLMVESASGELFRTLSELVRRIEPEVELRRRGSAEVPPEADRKRPLWLIGASLGIFVLGWVLSANGVAWQFTLPLFAVVYWLSGRQVLRTAFRNLFTRNLFDENLLMVIATAGAWAIGEFAEAAAVMLFFHVGEYFQDLAVERSRRSIAELMDIRPAFANLKKADGTVATVAPEEVGVAAHIIVKPGERIPLDGKVLSGSSRLDTAALTGESVPREAVPGDAVLSGTINLTGVLELEVTREYGDSTVSRILREVENAAGRKSRSERFITRFARIYTPVVFAAALLLATLPPLLADGEWRVWSYRALVFLVISCPCALVISVPLTFFAGIGGASRNGILVKGGSFLEALSRVGTVVFDKTGTLTCGRFEVKSVIPAEGVSVEEVLEAAVLAESFSSHPIAFSLRGAWQGKLDPGRVGEVEELSGLGVAAKVDGVAVLAGNRKLMAKAGIALPELEESGTLVYVASGGTYLGCVAIGDTLKPDAPETVKSLRRLGVSRQVLMTGDNSRIADAVGAELGLDEVHAELLPDGKVGCLEELMARSDRKALVAFVGDGINDAPVLARADVGIAMGGLGSDAAIESADVVIMTDEPGKLPEAIRMARRTVRIALENIVLALGIKLLVLAAGAFGVVTMWEAVFADVGVCLLAILNALRALHR